MEKLAVRILDRIEDGYEGTLKDSRDLLRFSVVAFVILVIGGIVLTVSVSDEDFWKEFEHAATILAGLALVLALPALSYAYNTDRAVRSILPDEHNLVPLPPRANDRRIKGTATAATDEILEGPAEHPAQSEVQFVEALEPWLMQPEDGPISDPSEVTGALSRHALERAIVAGAGIATVRRLIRDAKIFALGEPAGDTSVPGQGTESILLHFTVEIDGRDEVMLPIFTNRTVLSESLERNQDWLKWNVLWMDGGQLLKARDSDVILVINPWGGASEFQIPARTRKKKV
jgi:hypothetical protein